MKAGNKVKVIDGSWALSLINGKMQHGDGRRLKGYGVHTVLAVGCDLPADDSHITSPQRNDTIILADFDGTVTWIQERFLIPALGN